jgi:hypothetical protein
MWAARQQINSRHHDAGSAHSALYRTLFHKSHLQGMKPLIGSHALNRSHMPADGFLHWRQARQDSHSVKENGARSAFSLTTALFRSSQAQVLTEEIEQASATTRRYRDCLAIDG